MSKQIATITLNPAYDLIGYCENIQLGDVNLVQTNALLPAGKGINVAKVLNSLQIPLTVGGFLGKENRDGFNQLFNELNIIDKFHTVQGRTRINVKLTEASGEVTDLNFSGFDINPQDWDNFATSSLEWLSKMDMVAISGSLPAGVENEKFIHWLQQVKQVCPKIVFDSSRESLTAGLKAKPWLIKPNEKELEMFVGRSLPTIEDITKAGKELVEQGITHVIVSLGSKGAIWVSKEQTILAKPPKCNVISTVGAGDSMVAGLIYGFATNKSIKDTFIFASTVAALSVMQAGVGVSNMQELQNMLDKIEVETV
ncbi:1-phosphofructokinase [Orbaceae bacterium ac157xtp]